MRPYLAIIKDSFREARASRVLWILLMLVTVVLLGLAPFGYRRMVTGQIEPRDCLDWVGLLNQVEAAGEQGEPTPAGQIWRTISQEGREAIEKFPRRSQAVTRRDMPRFQTILREMNKMLAKPTYYDQAAWEGISINKEAQQLLAEKQTGALETNQTRRLNRLLLEAAFPNLMKRSQSEHIMFLWGPFDMDFGVALPFTAERVERIVNQTMVSLMSLLLSTVGVFVAILATAPQINQIFDEGSINLLLSKPVSRSLLYLAKFVGSCVFILIVAAYFIAGLTLVAGARFGVWDWRPLACLPLFVFMFMTYYCVSGLASIIWKNNIISIAAAILFWLVCVSLGLVKGTIELAHINNIGITQLTEAGGELVAVNQMGQLFHWDDATGNWQEIFQQKQAGQNQMLVNMMLKPRILGPVVDQEADRMLAIRSTGAFRNISAGSPLLWSGQRFENYASERGPMVPAGPLGLYETQQGEFLLVASDGIYQLRGAVDKSQAPLSVFGVEIPFTGNSSPFERITPKGAFTVTQPAAAAMDLATGNIAVYSQGRVSVCTPTAEGAYEAHAEQQVLDETDRPATIAIGGDSVLLAMDDGTLHLLRADTLQPSHEPITPVSDTPRLALASSAGKFAVLYQTGYLWEIDPKEGTAQKAAVAGQGDITAATFLANGELAVAEQAIRVTSYKLGAGRQNRWAPPLGMLERVYYWLVQPLYWAFPKPGELDSTARYVLTGEKTLAEEDSLDLVEQQIKLRPWAPLPSTALFIVLMLGMSCAMMERQEF